MGKQAGAYAAIVAFPSDEKSRRSERFVSLNEVTKGFVVVPSRYVVALPETK